MENRFWEIDFFRGLAVLAMIFYHLLFDLTFLGILDFSRKTLFWFLGPRLIAGVFIFLVGISMTISFRRRREKLSSREMDRKYIERGIRIFIYGLAVTLVIWIYFKEALVVFGILHFIGISIVMAYLVLKKGLGNEKVFILVLFLLFFGILLQTIEFEFPWLLWLGFPPKNLFMLDYFPLLPWFGVILLGIYSGRKLYGGFNRKFDIKELSNPIVDLFALLGRNSLEIYFLHQPLIIGSIILLT